MHNNSYIRQLKSRVLKVFLFIFGTVFLLFILLNILLFLFGRPILREALQEVISEKSNGLFSVDFDGVSIDLSSSSIKLKEFHLQLDTARFEELRKTNEISRAIYDVKLPEVYLRGINLRKVYEDSELQIEAIAINNPQVILVGDFVGKKMNLGNEVVYRDMFPLLEPFFTSIRVSRVRVEDGFLGLLNHQKDLVHSSQAKHITLTLSDFYLDKDVFTHNDKILFSENVALNIKDYGLDLNDNLHRFHANQITIESKSGELIAEGVSLEPKSGSFKMDTINQDMYEVWVPELRINGADFYKAHFEKRLNIEELLLKQPFVRLINHEDGDSTLTKRKYRFSTNLYSLIEGNLLEVAVNRFHFEHGAFQQVNKRDLKQINYDIKDLSILLDQFLIDSMAYLNDQKVLYAEEVDVQVNGYSMRLADNIHSLKASSLKVSTRDSLIVAKDLTLDHDLADSLAERKNGTLYRISVPEVLMKGTDMRQAFNHKILPIEKLEIKTPKVSLTSQVDLKERSFKRSLKTNDLYKLTAPYLQEVLIDTVYLKDGFFDLVSSDSGQMKAFSNSKISFHLQEFRLDTTMGSQHNKIFFANNIDVQLKDYSLKLADDIHIFNADEIHVSTFNDQVVVKGFSLEPIPALDPVVQMRRYGKSTHFNVFIPALRISNANIHEAYFEKNLKVKNIEIDQPDLKLTTYRELKGRKLRTMAKGEFYAMISPYLESIQVDSLELDKGNFNLVTNTDGHFNDLSRNNVAIRILGFQLDKEEARRNDRTLYADDIEVKLRDYRLHLPDSVHQLIAKEIVYSTGKSEILAEGVKLYPEKERQNRFQLKYNWFLDIPQVRISDVDVNAAYYKKEMNVGGIELKNPVVKMINHKNLQKRTPNDQEVFKDVFLSLPKGMEGVSIGNILLSGGNLSLVSQNGDEQLVYSKGDIAMDIKKVNLIRQKKDDSAHADFNTEDMNVVVSDYFLKLPDSIYHFKADRLVISSKKGGVELEGAHLFPKDKVEAEKLLQQNGRNKLFEVKTPKIIMEGINFDQLYSQRWLEVKNINLQEPDVTISSFPLLAREASSKQDLTQQKDKINSDSISPIKLKKDSKRQIKSQEGDLYKLISPYLRGVQIHQLNFGKGKLSYHKKEADDFKQYSLKNLFGEVKGFRVDEKYSHTADRFFYTDDIRLETHDFKYNLPDSLYTLSAGKVGFSTAKQQIYADSLKLQPRYMKYLFSQIVGYETDRVMANMGEVRLENVDLHRLLESHELKAPLMTIDGLSVHTFRDKRLKDPDFKEKIMPQEVLRNLDFYVHLDTVRLKNGQITIEEQSEQAQQSGMITFNDLSVEMRNVTNDSILLQNGAQGYLNAHAYLMGQGELQANIRVPLADKSNTFYFDGHLIGEMNLDAINPMLENLVFVTVKSGKAKKLNFDLVANKYEAKGKMRFHYNNLRIGVIDPKTGKTGGLKGGLISLLANTFVVKSRNPSRTFHFREGEIYYPRDSSKSIYNFWWKSLFSGFKSTFGIEGISKEKNKKSER
ncbi:hypothetical protein [Xanthovirga aplysinae]|uniref:hypothetical protein n=1 Tax=Xanthovirga aplysinae TaxID=2529853 RepID=UPI0012BD7B46|nr:hypothetical protein [Xanthovirga aplysinae]MTI31369.1 hypothetical protein [Xanthovirga aplysinae]